MLRAAVMLSLLTIKLLIFTLTIKLVTLAGIKISDGACKLN